MFFTSSYQPSIFPPFKQNDFYLPPFVFFNQGFRGRHRFIYSVVRHFVWDLFLFTCTFIYLFFQYSHREECVGDGVMVSRSA